MGASGEVRLTRAGSLEEKGGRDTSRRAPHPGPHAHPPPLPGTAAPSRLGQQDQITAAEAQARVLAGAQAQPGALGPRLPLHGACAQLAPPRARLYLFHSGGLFYAWINVASQMGLGGEREQSVWKWRKG